MFCVECGKEPEKLYDGLCKECFKDTLDADISNKIEIEVCSVCGAVHKEDKWIEKADVYSIMLERIDYAISISPEVEKYSFTTSFNEEAPLNIEAEVEVKLLADDVIREKELTTNIIFKKKQCETCSKIQSDYYEAILQVRPTDSDMTEEQKMTVKQIVDEEIKVRRGEERNIFVTSTEERHGGLDFYLSDNGAAKKLSRNVAKEFGGKITTSSELVGREDGQNIHRMTYSVRLPPYEEGDFVIFESDVYRVSDLGREGKNVTMLKLSSGESVKVNKRRLEDIEVLGDGELIRRTVIVSETEDEIKVLEPDTYKTKTLLKPKGFNTKGDEVEVVKTFDDLLLLPRID